MSAACSNNARAEAEGMTDWRPIKTAPKDGTWFLICNAEDGFGSYEVGRYDPLLWPEYVETDDGLYRKEMKVTYEWTGFNNMHRATHWQPLPAPPPHGDYDHDHPR